MSIGIVIDLSIRQMKCVSWFYFNFPMSFFAGVSVLLLFVLLKRFFFSFWNLTIDMDIKHGGIEELAIFSWAHEHALYVDMRKTNKFISSACDDVRVFAVYCCSVRGWMSIHFVHLIKLCANRLTDCFFVVWSLYALFPFAYNTGIYFWTIF